MLGMVVNLVLRLCLAIVALAVRLALALGFLAGRVVVLILSALWQGWRARRTAAREAIDHGAPESPHRPPAPSSPARFTPRPLHRRPGR